MSEMKTTSAKKTSGYNFGLKGWRIIGFEIVMLFFMTGITVDGLNTIVPKLAAYHNWSSDVLLSISTPASIVALFACVMWAAFIEKGGLKRVTLITMVLAGISLIAYGNSVNVVMYAISLVCVVTFINAFACNCGFAIVANWFPTKSGIANGIATIGMNLASAIINWVLTGLSNVFEITGALTVLGIVLFVLAGLVALFVKGTPEEDGCYPDNDPAVAEMLKNEEMLAEIGSQFSYKDAIKNKYVWMYGIGNGFFGLATVGIMSQLLSFFQEVRGYDASSALTMLTIAAVIGIAGAWIWGAVDQKLGPQKTCLIFGIWYLAGIILLISPLKIGMYVGLIMLGASIGGNGQFGPVLAAQAFGRKDFSVSFSCMNMISGIVRSCSYAVLAVLHSMSNGYSAPYTVFGIIAVVGGCMIFAMKEKKKEDVDEDTVAAY